MSKTSYPSINVERLNFTKHLGKDLHGFTIQCSFYLFFCGGGGGYTNPGKFHAQYKIVLQVKATAVNIEDIMTAVGRRPLVSLTATQENPVVLGQEFSGM